jgi:hypothetical protein
MPTKNLSHAGQILSLSCVIDPFRISTTDNLFPPPPVAIDRTDILAIASCGYLHKEYVHTHFRIFNSYYTRTEGVRPLYVWELVACCIIADSLKSHPLLGRELQFF